MKEQNQFIEIRNNRTIDPFVTLKTENSCSKLFEGIPSYKFNSLSLRTSKSSRSDIGSTCLLASSVKSEHKTNECFSYEPRLNTNGSCNPFLQDIPKPNTQKYDYATLNLKRNTKNLSAPSTISNHSQEYRYPTLQRNKSAKSFSSTSKSASLGLKKCLSVSTLKESLASIENPRSYSMKKSDKKVSFTNLQIREYELKLGDHPMCESGPPITLGWNYNQKRDISLDSLVDAGSASKGILDATTRYKMLRNAGYSTAEILQADKNRIKKHQLKPTENETLPRHVGSTKSNLLKSVNRSSSSHKMTYADNTSMVRMMTRNPMYQHKSADSLLIRKPRASARVA